MDDEKMPPCMSLLQLPDELLLEIMRHLDSLRASEPQAIAMSKLKEERKRQSINQERRLALHSLCLTSRRLRRIATPVLYASFTSTSTWKGMEHLTLFHRTISTEVHLGEHRSPFSKYVRYIENRFSDHLGNNLYDETEEYDTIQMIARYFYLLAEIVKLAPNLQHLCVVSLDTEDMSFWQFILPPALAVDPAIEHAGVSHVSFSKLETLCFQVNTSSYRHNTRNDWYARIVLTMKSAPLLKEVQVCGIESDDDPSAASATSFVPFKQLRRLDITKCFLKIEEVVDLWRACEGLRHVTCEWSYLDCMTEPPFGLVPGLLNHAETLETLRLDLREVRLDLPRPPKRLFNSFRAFINLQSLTICERFTSDDHYTWEGRIADLLPVSLESLTILRYEDGLFEFGCHDDRTRNLRHLAEDCPTALPRLKYVAVHDFLEFHASELRCLFSDAGVQFVIVRETL